MKLTKKWSRVWLGWAVKGIRFTPWYKPEFTRVPKKYWHFSWWKLVVTLFLDKRYAKWLHEQLDTIVEGFAGMENE